MTSRLPILFLLTLSSSLALHAAEPVPIRSKQSARTIQYLAPSGKPVKQGEVIAVLDCMSIAEELQKVETELATQSGIVRSREKEIVQQLATNTEKEADAAYEATKAKRAYQKYLEGDAPAQELTFQLALNDADAALKKQTDRFNARDKLLEDGYIQKVEYETEEVLLHKAKLIHSAAILKLKAFQKYERAQATEQLARTLKERELAIEHVKDAGIKAVEKLRAELAAAQKRVKILTLEREDLVQQLNRTVITAPASGAFTWGDPHRPEIKIRRGAKVAGSDLIGSIAP